MRKYRAFEQGEPKLGLREFDRKLIRNTPRGVPAPPHEPELAYAFTDADRRAMLQDPACRREAFKGALEDPDSLRAYGPHERWVISEKSLIEVGLSHWKPDAVDN